MKPSVNKIFGILGANAALLNAFNAHCAQRQDKPNVVFVLIDDMGWRDLGCCGSPFYETPHIDSLARGSVRFTQAYASCHVSSPARASLLTGLYPATVGVTDWLPGRREYPFQKSSTTRVEQDLPHDVGNIARTMKNGGYSTAIIGKWHLGENGAKPQEYGFDVHIPDGYLRGWPDTYFYPFGMNGYDGQPGDYLTDKMTDEAVQYIRSHSEEPFFLLLSHFATHDPIQGRPDLVEKYTKKLAAMPVADIPGYILEGNPDDPDALSQEQCRALLSRPEYQAHRILPHNLVKVKQIQDNVNFAAMVESVDESVGRIMQTLRELGISDNTIVIFFADNGGMSAANYGNPNKVIDPSKVDQAYASSMLPLRGGKGWMYEGGLRVPFIVNWPGKGLSGFECAVPVTTPDLYPTIVSMTGVKPEKGAGRDGVDITPLLKGQSIADRSLYWHFPHYSNHGMQSPCGAVRRGNYKLIEYFGNGTVQLFDVVNDPSETVDISSSNPKMVAELKKDLADWRDRVNARMPSPNRSYDANVARILYEDAAPVRYWPCRVKDEIYGLQGSEMDILKEANATDEIQSKLIGALRDIVEYKKTGNRDLFEGVDRIWREYNRQKKTFAGNDLSLCLWDVLCSQMLDLTGNGRFAGAMIPLDRASGYYGYWHTVANNHIAGEVNNNLDVFAFADGQLATGVKFGDGSINVTRSDSTIAVTLKEYTQPYTYKTYAIEVFVGAGKADVSATINGKSVQAKVNNRGFVNLRREWKQGDRIEISMGQ